MNKMTCHIERKMNMGTPIESLIPWEMEELDRKRSSKGPYIPNAWRNQICKEIPSGCDDYLDVNTFRRYCSDNIKACGQEYSKKKI